MAADLHRLASMGLNRMSLRDLKAKRDLGVQNPMNASLTASQVRDLPASESNFGARRAAVIRSFDRTWPAHLFSA